MKRRRSPPDGCRFEDLPELVTPEEARAFLRISRNAIYSLIKEQRVPALRFGRLIRIRKSALVGE